MRQSLNILDFIERTSHGREHDPEVLREFIRAVKNGEVKDCQIAAWLMAMCLKAIPLRETAKLAVAMAEAGLCLGWSKKVLAGPTVDTYSTGCLGGDKTPLVLWPLLAAAGCYLPILGKRHLLRKLGVSIPGFRTDLSETEVRTQVERIGLAIGPRPADMVPINAKLRDIRNLTATDSIALVAAYEMAEMIAGGAQIILADVRFGSGTAKMWTNEAIDLAKIMVEIGRCLVEPLRVRALVTRMDRPLGDTIGNVLELWDVIDTLRGEGPPEVNEIVLTLGSMALVSAGFYDNENKARSRLEGLLLSGAALQKFGELIEAQGGDRRMIDEPALGSYPDSRSRRGVSQEGYVAEINATTVAAACTELGAGTDGSKPFDPLVGVKLFVRPGDPVHIGQRLLAVYDRNQNTAIRIAERLEATAFNIVTMPVGKPLLKFAQF